MKIRVHLLLVALLLLVSPVLAQDTEQTPEVTSEPTPDAANDITLHLRFAHFSLGAGVVDVYINDARFIEGLALQQVSEWLLTIPDTPMTFAFVPTGGTLAEALLVSEPYVMRGGDWKTIVLMASADGENLHIQELTEDFSPIGQGESRLALFQAMVNQPPFNVDSNGVQIARALTNPTTLLENEDGLLIVNIRRGEHRLNYTLSNGLPAFSSNTLRLGEYRNYLVAVMGSLTNPLFVLASTNMAEDIPVREIVVPEAGEIPVMPPEMTADAETTPEVAILATNTDVPDANATVAAVTDVPLAELTIEPEPTESLPTATATLTPTVTNTPMAGTPTDLPLGEASPELTAAPTDLPSGETTPEPESTAETTEEAAPAITLEPTLTPTPSTFDIGLRPGTMRVRVAHLAPGVEDLQVFLNGDELVSTIGFAGISESVDILGGDYELALVAPNREEDLIVYRSQVQLLTGSVMVLAIIGSPEAESSELAVQPLVENYAPAGDGLARLNFFQAIPDAQFLRLIANDSDVIVSGLNFPGLFGSADTGYVSADILAGTYELRLEDEDGNFLIGTEIRMGANRTYMLIAAGLRDRAFFLFESNALPERGQ